MARTYIFKLRMNREERKALTVLSDKLQRSQSDVIRYLVRNASRELIENNKADIKDNSQLKGWQIH